MILVTTLILVQKFHTIDAALPKSDVYWQDNIENLQMYIFYIENVIQ